MNSKTGEVPSVGFDSPIPSGDEIVRALREKHSLNDRASMADIEPVATALLGDPLTALDGAQLVLNRRVDGKERMVAEMIYLPGTIAEEKFALLLMEATVEQTMMQKGETDFGTKLSLFD